MKKSDLYELAVKILGLYLVILVINQLREVITYLIMFSQPEESQALRGMGQTSYFSASIVGFIILVTFSALMIFKTRQITRLICKQSDYAESVKLFAGKDAIYEIALVFTGLLTIVFNLPDLLMKLRSYIHVNQAEMQFRNNDISLLVTSGVKVVVGLFALIYRGQLASLLSKKESESVKAE